MDASHIPWMKNVYIFFMKNVYEDFVGQRRQSRVYSIQAVPEFHGINVCLPVERWSLRAITLGVGKKTASEGLRKLENN